LWKPSRIGVFSDLEEHNQTRNPEPYSIPNAQRRTMTGESGMVTSSKACVKKFQDLSCGREFIDVAVRGASGRRILSTLHNQPNQIGEKDGK